MIRNYLGCSKISVFVKKTTDASWSINTIIPVSIALAGVGANIFVMEASEALLPKIVEGIPKTVAGALLSPEGASPKILGE